MRFGRVFFSWCPFGDFGDSGGCGLIPMAGAGVGIKEYSNWPTIPQLYVNKEFIGGCDILVSMHQSGELEDLLEKEKVLVPPEESADANTEKPSS